MNPSTEHDYYEAGDVDDLLEDSPRLATRWWSGPSGMSGGAGRDELVITPDRRILYMGTGDSPAALYGPEDLGPVGDDPSATIADWLLSINAVESAALELEPLDPSSVLDKDERGEWLDLMSKRSDGLSLELNTQQIESLRSRMRGIASYARVAEALRNPRGRPGKALLNALRG